MERISLVNPLGVKARCEIRGCTNRAVWAVGKPSHRALRTHYCTECLTKIIEDAEKTLKESVANEEKGDKMPAEVSSAADTEPSEEENIPISISQKVEAKDVGEIPAENKHLTSDTDSEETYVCRHCGATFKKPDELNIYKSHVMKCKGKDKQ